MPNIRISREAVVNFFAVLIFPFCIISLEAILFHLLMIVSNYLHATTIISIAMFGIALGGLVSFYLLKLNRIAVLVLSSVVFFLSIGLSYYSIVRLDNFNFPWLLIFPFFFGSVIVSSVFSRADSHKIYFVDLTASAAGVIYPIVAVSLFKSENTLLILSILPLVFLLIQFFMIKNIIIKISGLIVTASMISGIIWFLDLNLSIPREIKTEDYNKKIIPYITSPVDRDILNEVYKTDIIPGKMVLRTDEPYKELMARNVINKTGFYPFVMDLSINYKPLLASEKNLKIYTDKLEKYTFLFSEDNLMGRVEYITSSDIDFFYINNGAFYDRVIYGDRGTNKDIRFPGYIDNANVFIMGASADGIVNSLKRMPGRTRITGVEFNPVIHKTMMSGYYFEKSSRAYEDTVIYRTEGRAYLKATDETYDMITHMNNHAEHGAVCTLAPEYLHTVEAISEMVGKLTDRGILVYEEVLWSVRSDWAFYKFINTIVTALRESGIKNPEDHLIIYKWDYWNYDNPGVRSVFIKKSPFTGEEKRINMEILMGHLQKEPSPLVSERNILAFPGEFIPGFTGNIIRGEMPESPVQLPDYYWIDDFEKDILNYIPDPGDRDFVNSLYNINPRKEISKGWDFVSTVYNYKNGKYVLKKGISDPDKKRYMALLDKTDYSYKMDLTPVRDNKPFPFNVYTEKKEVLKILRIVGILSLIIIIPVMILIIVKYSSHKLALFNHTLFFISTGFGFMLVEIVLMQYMQRFLGIPTYSVIVTLGALLFFSGIGSLISSGWRKRWIHLTVFAIPVVIFIYDLYLDSFFNCFSASSYDVRLTAGVALMVPLSLMMGIPFPKAMEKIKKDISREYATLMYSISGAAGTIATTTALFLNVSYGFSFTFMIGMAAYIIGALLLLVILRGER